MTENCWKKININRFTDKKTNFSYDFVWKFNYFVFKEKKS